MTTWSDDSPNGRTDSKPTPKKAASNSARTSVGIIQQANLRCLDKAFKQHWNCGENILLCWCLDGKGVQVLPAPHYFLGQFSAGLNEGGTIDRLDALNGNYIRELISGPRQLSPDDFAGAARRLQLSPITVQLPVPLAHKPELFSAIDEMIQRYSINFIDSRAVLLFDIVDFSLVSPFEQTSQLNSLSYSLNAAHNKLLQQNSNINFSRTTTGDGYYVWHKLNTPRANLELFEFMILVIADNAFAGKAVNADKKYGQIIPKIRAGFHIGSHFEFHQVDGMQPGHNSYIVGDVTIELARMLDLAGEGQIFIGDFDTLVPTSLREGAYLIPANSQRFTERAVKLMADLKDIKFANEEIESIHCFLTGETGASGGETVRRFRITDKHGQSRNVYNLKIFIIKAGNSKPVMLGHHDSYLPKRYYRRRGDNKAVVNRKSFGGLPARPGGSISISDDKK